MQSFGIFFYIILNKLVRYFRRRDHDDDVIMGAIASLITSFKIVYSTVYSDADQRKHQSSASLAFVRGIHRGQVNSRYKWPVTRKIFPFDDVITLSCKVTVMVTMWAFAALLLVALASPLRKICTTRFRKALNSMSPEIILLCWYSLPKYCFLIVDIWVSINMYWLMNLELISIPWDSITFTNHFKSRWDQLPSNENFS